MNTNTSVERQPTRAELRNRQRASDLFFFALCQFGIGIALIVTGFVHFDTPRLTRTIPGFIFLGIGFVFVLFFCGVVEEADKSLDTESSRKKVAKKSDWLYLCGLIEFGTGIALIIIGFVGPNAPDLGLYIPGFILFSFAFLSCADAFTRETKEKAAIAASNSNPNPTTLSPVYSVSNANTGGVAPPPPYVPPTNYGY